MMDTKISDNLWPSGSFPKLLLSFSKLNRCFLAILSLQSSASFCHSFLAILPTRLPLLYYLRNLSAIQPEFKENNRRNTVF